MPDDYIMWNKNRCRGLIEDIVYADTDCVGFEVWPDADDEPAEVWNMESTEIYLANDEMIPVAGMTEEDLTMRVLAS